MRNFKFDLKTKVILALVAMSVGISTVFTNCGHAILGDLKHSSSSSDSTTSGIDGAQSVNVQPSACPNNSAPVGLSTSGTLICAPTSGTPSTGGSLTCPSSTLPYDVVSGIIYCLPATSWDIPTGSICPVGQFVVSFTPNGSITCASPVLGGGGVNGMCPAGQYVIGIQNNTIVCAPLPSPVPSAFLCPAGNVLLNVTNAVPTCMPTPWSSGNTNCTAGTYPVGWDQQNHPLCATLNYNNPGTNVSCPTGQILLSVNGNTPNCVTAPNPDFTHPCGNGFIASQLANGVIQCVSAPSGAAICPPGQYVTGLNSGLPVCQSVAINNLPSVCPYASYPIGLSNGNLVCAGFSNDSYPNPGQICFPGAPSICAVINGIGGRTCNSSGTGYTGPCQLIACNPGYIADANGICQLENCVPGTTQACPVDHGSGTQTCNSTGSWNACQIQCDPGFTLNGNMCIGNACRPGSTVRCSRRHGYGTKTCNTSGTGYGNCVIESCQNGCRYRGGDDDCHDETPPRTTVHSNHHGSRSGDPVNIDFTCADNETGVASVTCSLDGGAPQACNSHVQYNGLRDGDHTCTINAVDNAGNRSSTQVHWNQHR